MTHLKLIKTEEYILDRVKGVNFEGAAWKTFESEILPYYADKNLSELEMAKMFLQFEARFNSKL